MTQKRAEDPIIHSLVRKKKELLHQLLALSIQSAIAEVEQESVAQNRARLITDLSLNDSALARREEETGVNAGKQEARLFHDIRTILNAIQDNNTNAISRLEKEIKHVERERFRLVHGNKLTGYIAQQKGYQAQSVSGGSQKPYSSGSRLLDGTL